MSGARSWFIASASSFKWLVTCLLACVVCVGATYYVCRKQRQPPAAVMIGFPLQAEVIYFDNAPRGSAFHHGTNKFVFRNLSTDKPITIHLPPLAVYLEVQTNNFHKLEDPARWPKFTNERRIALPPNGEQVFEESYESLGSTTSPGWCFVFGPSDGVHESQGEEHVGCVIAPGKEGAVREPDVE